MKPRQLARQFSVALLVLLIASIGLTAGAPTVVAQDKEYRWDEIAVELEVRPNGEVRVEETQTYRFTSGSFTRAYRDVRLDRLDEIVDVGVSEGGRAYTPGDGRPGTFRTTRQGGERRIEWWFDPTENAARTFRIGYTVRGAIRRYEGGDQLWWKAVGTDRDQPVERSVVTVRLPEPVAAEGLRFASYGAATDGGQQIDPRTVRFVGGRVGPSEELEVRVQFPPGLVGGTAPGWQADFDRQQEYDERVRPLVNVGVLAGSLLALVGGLVGVIVHWRRRGADPSVGTQPALLDEPPSGLPPGLAGTLVDERVETRDILATLLDLARRDFLHVEQTEPEGGFFGLGAKADFRLTRREGDGRPLREHEQALLKALFGRRELVELSKLRNKFHKKIPGISKAMYGEVVEAGLMPDNPERVRRKYLVVAGVLLFVLWLPSIGLAILLSFYTDFAWLPSAALFIVVGAVGALALAMPRRTREGAVEAARWRAFRAYLEHVARRTDERIRADLFERYLPYAVAFGLQESWLEGVLKRGRVNDGWTPYWYGWSGHGSGGFDGDGAGGGAPSLTVPSLQQMSDGLATMLNDAGSTLTSTPSSSGGSGGWSGGGGGGGGGSGGGRGGAS